MLLKWCISTGGWRSAQSAKVRQWHGSHFHRQKWPWSGLSRSLGPCSHYLRPSTDLIDFAWGAREMHCGSVRPFGSVACVKKLRDVKLFRQCLIPANQIAVMQIHSTCFLGQFCNNKREEARKSGRYIYFLKKYGMTGLFSVGQGNFYYLTIWFVSDFWGYDSIQNRFLIQNDLIHNDFCFNL